MQLGFIGTGVMGTGIIVNLLKANHHVTVFNRTKAHAQAVIDAGAVWADSPQPWQKSATSHSPWWVSPMMSKKLIW